MKSWNHRVVRAGLGGVRKPLTKRLHGPFFGRQTLTISPETLAETLAESGNRHPKDHGSHGPTACYKHEFLSIGGRDTRIARLSDRIARGPRLDDRPETCKRQSRQRQLFPPGESMLQPGQCPPGQGIRPSRPGWVVGWWTGDTVLSPPTDFFPPGATAGSVQ